MKMAEVLGEFDKEYPPSPFSFCRRISLADYDREGSEETHVELEKLLDFIEHNPKVYYNVIRKRKRDELNLFPFVKVKLMSAIQGEDYLQSYFPEDDCKKQLEGWKDDLVASYDFGQEAAGNGKRFSKRLAAKNKDKEAKKLEMTSTAPAVPPVPPPLPPPLPPPVLPPQSRMNDDTENRNPTETCTSLTSSKAINEELFKSIRNVSGRVGQSCVKKNIQEDIETNTQKHCEIKTMKKGFSNHQKNLNDEIASAKKKLRCINPQNSPCGTPYQVSKSRREARRTSDEYPMFNIALVHKFRNTRSPTPSPSGHFNSSSSFCESPY